MNLPSFDEDDDEDDDVSIADIKAAFGLLSLFGFDISIAGQEFNRHGDITEQVYIDDEIAVSFSVNYCNFLLYMYHWKVLFVYFSSTHSPTESNYSTKPLKLNLLTL